MPVTPTELLAVLGIIVTIATVFQTWFLIPYRVAQLEAKQADSASDREALIAIRQELALLRRDFQWLASQVAKHDGIEFPPNNLTPNG